MNPILLSEGVDFNIKAIKTFNIFGMKFVFTNSMWNALCIMVAMVVLAVIVNRKIKKLDPMKPQKGFIGIVEMLVGMLDKTTVDTMGPKCLGFSAFYGGMIVYIMLCNLSGLMLWFVPYKSGIIIDFMRPPTADLAVTLSLALITFFMTQGFAIKAKGVKGWLKALTEPVAFLTPINIIGEVANPVSLSFRLMGNVLAGTIIMGLYYGMLPMITHILTPALHFYFDVFSGLLQAYIFMMLSMIYVSGAME